MEIENARQLLFGCFSIYFDLFIASAYNECLCVCWPRGLALMYTCVYEYNQNENLQ